MYAFIIKLQKLYKLLPSLVIRDIKEKYAGSTIGLLWTFLQPILFILLFWLVFSRIIRIKIPTDTGEIPFLAFLLSGLLPWYALQEGVVRGAASVIEKGSIIKKVLCPTELFPLSVTLSSFIQHGIGFFIFLVIFFIYSKGVALFQIPILLLLLIIQIVLTTGLSLFVSALSVYIRDILQILNVFFLALFYMTPILYPIDMVPKGLKIIIRLNPFTPMIECYHSVILYGKYPDPKSMAYFIIFTAASFMCGVFVFRRLKRGFTDVL